MLCLLLTFLRNTIQSPHTSPRKQEVIRWQIYFDMNNDKLVHLLVVKKLVLPIDSAHLGFLNSDFYTAVSIYRNLVLTSRFA